MSHFLQCFAQLACREQLQLPLRNLSGMTASGHVICMADITQQERFHRHATKHAEKGFGPQARLL